MEASYDHYARIKVALPAAGNRLTKVKAEVSMAGVLQVGLALATLVAGSAAWRTPEPGRFVLMAVLALLAGSAAAIEKRLGKRYAIAVAAHWEILKDLGHPLGTKAPAAAGGQLAGKA